MSQQMNILRCFSCKTYQVHIVKKAKKWQCKICNFKQTFKQVYFQGSGKDCRIFVQKLNLMKEHETRENVSFDIHNNTNDNYLNVYPKQSELKVTENKWAKYLDTTDEIESNTFKASNSQNNSFEQCDDKMHIDNDDAMYEYSEDEHSMISSDFSCENDPKNNYDYEEEYDNVVPKETLNNMSYSDHNSKSNDLHSKNVNETKCTKNIFDDNEDFDLSIDF